MSSVVAERDAACHRHVQDREEKRGKTRERNAARKGQRGDVMTGDVKVSTGDKAAVADDM